MTQGLTSRQATLKRAFDIVFSAAALLLLGWLVPVLAWLARRDTGGSGIFHQERIGLHGQRFNVLKIRTMRAQEAKGTTVTTRDDPRITPLGARLRRWKLDEIPQLWNVLRGDMSFVGPRPDVPGYYDRLVGDDRLLLTVRPGITSPAAVEFRDEEVLLANAEDPKAYNDQVLFPSKVELNRRWLEAWSLRSDVACVLDTLNSMTRSVFGRSGRA